MLLSRKQNQEPIKTNHCIGSSTVIDQKTTLSDDVKRSLSDYLPKWLFHASDEMGSGHKGLCLNKLVFKTPEYNQQNKVAFLVSKNAKPLFTKIISSRFSRHLKGFSKHFGHGPPTCPPWLPMRPQCPHSLSAMDMVRHGKARLLHFPQKYLKIGGVGNIFSKQCQSHWGRVAC